MLSQTKSIVSSHNIIVRLSGEGRGGSSGGRQEIMLGKFV